MPYRLWDYSVRVVRHLADNRCLYLVAMLHPYTVGGRIRFASGYRCMAFATIYRMVLGEC